MNLPRYLLKEVFHNLKHYFQSTRRLGLPLLNLSIHEENTKKNHIFISSSKGVLYYVIEISLDLHKL